MDRHSARVVSGPFLIALLGLVAPFLVPAAVPPAADVALAQAQKDVRNRYEGDPAAIEEGRELFARRCAFCHGGGGHGGKGPDLTDEKWKWGGTNGQVFASIAGGRPGTQMGAFSSSLDVDQIWKIMAYIRSQYHGDPSKNPVKDLMPVQAAAPAASPGEHPEASPETSP